MAEYSANAVQTVNPGETAIFTDTIVPCNLGLIQHLDSTPNFILSGWVPNSNGCCRCNRQNAQYNAKIGCNIAVSEGGTAGTISIAVSVDGATLGYSEMDSTPAAVGDFNHVNNEVTVPILNGCCQTVAIRNISSQPIDIKNLVMDLSRSDLK